MHGTSAYSPQKEAARRRSRPKTATSTRACPQFRPNIDGHRPITHRILRRGTFASDRAGFGRSTSPSRRVSAGARQPAAEASRAVAKTSPPVDSANAIYRVYEGTIVRPCDFGHKGRTQPMFTTIRSSGPTRSPTPHPSTEWTYGRVTPRAVRPLLAYAAFGRDESQTPPTSR